MGVELPADSMKVPLRYRCFRGIVRIVLKLYYQSIESYGTQFIPKRGRTLFIGNHQAGAIDGILVLASLEQVVRAVMKHTLEKEPIVGFFAKGLEVVPVYRTQDLSESQLKSSSSKERNKKAFEAIEQAFVDGQSCLVFPEGISHDKPQIQKLKAGAARMLLESEAAHDFRLGLQWLPVSIDLEIKDRPGFRALLHYHPPRKVDHYREAYAQDPEKAVHDLRDEMQNYLEEITLNFASWDDRAFLERLTEIWLAKSPSGVLLNRHNQVMKWKRMMDNSQSTPEEKLEWEKLRKQVEKVSTSLDTIGIRPKEVLRRKKEGRHRRFAQVSLNMTLWAPLFTYGVLYWLVPLRMVKFGTAKGAKGERDVISTYHVVISFVLFPLWLTLTSLASYFVFGLYFTIAMAIFSVASGVSLVTSARRIRVRFRNLINMYRYSGLTEFLDDHEQKIYGIWSQAAKVWNMSLKKQTELNVKV